MLEEGVEVKFEGRYGVLKLEVAENFGVNHADGADLGAIEEHRDSAGGEEPRVAVVLDQLVVLSADSVDLDHDEVEKTVDDFEVGGQIEHGGTNHAHVAASSVSSGVKHAAVADLKNFLRNLLFLVLLEALHEAR